jgi:hypothetical protein
MRLLRMPRRWAKTLDCHSPSPDWEVEKIVYHHTLQQDSTGMQSDQTGSEWFNRQRLFA